MENENKYYIPLINEFHVGFEYKHSPMGKEWWKEAIMTEGNLNNKQAEGIKFIVKYLDKEDVESLDFKRIYTDYRKYKLITTLIFKKENYTIVFYCKDITDNLNLNIKENITIYRDDKHRTPNIDGTFKQRCIFEGTIKNRSELKILLNQLNIN